ncbi:FAD-binding oxidoreductase [Nonomuraea rhizosphaerae]|uniref:FAD-binding oxidoreductase n=1 Tax=Nonomuraea rhizosphaerae TaxID=2665663 RepID=UPI001C5CD0CC|nr:FAD-binding oxidoreductase [Nonomuraea rhizosphaerae]
MNDDGGIKVTPEDRRYPALCRGFNPRWLAHPQYIRLVSTNEQVKHALQYAMDNKPATGTRTRVTVRSGGHCYENFVCADDVRVIIDVSLMNGIYDDPAMGAICVEAGATNADLRKQLYLKTGKVLPGGSCPSVGVGGHVPAGGFGLLSRQFGLTVDYLYAVEVAVVDKEGQVKLVTACRDHKGVDDDLYRLWWAHAGGGGGNFGIVTKFWFKDLPDAPQRVLLAGSGWKWSEMGDTSTHFAQIIRTFCEFFASPKAADPAQFGPLFAILLLTHRSKDKLGLIAQIDAGVPDAKARMEAFHQVMGSAIPLDLVELDEAHGEYPALTGLDGPTMLPWDVVDKLMAPTDNLRAGKYKSAYMLKPLTEQHISALWEALACEGDVQRDAVVQIDSYGAAINKVAVDDTAVLQRSSILKLQHQVYWPAAADDGDQLRWIRELYRNMYRDTGGVPVSATKEHPTVTDGCYIGYPDVDLNGPPWNTSKIPWSTLYYGRHYAELRKVKKCWDPRNVFRHQQSIEPPT